MGLLLKELLKILCVNQWCYSVFWKTGCQNPKLLIWEECHYESTPCLVSPHITTIGNPVLPFEGRESHWGCDIHSSQPEAQGGDGVHLLINKMMINNQVHVVGEGIVGRAAFTGNHEWILANDCIGNTHPPEVLNEVHHQFSAGIQTIAVIPVCPHGVVQLGSSMAIVENMGFVNNVKSLILQLGCFPGVLLSDNHITEESAERIGMPVSMNFSGNYRLPNSITLLPEMQNQQILSPRALGIANQLPSSQIRQIQDNPQPTPSSFCTTHLTNTVAQSSNGNCELRNTQLMESDNPFRSQLKKAVVETEVIPCNPDAWLNQHAALYNSRTRCRQQPINGHSDANKSILSSLEQQFLSDVGGQNNVNSNANALDNFTVKLMRSNGGLMTNGCSLATGRGLQNGASCQTGPTSNACHVLNPQIFDIKNPSLRKDQVSLSSLVDQVCARAMFSGGSNQKHHSTDVKHTQNELTASKEKMEADLFQSFNIPLAQPGDSLKHVSESTSTITANVKYEGPYSQPPSGDDLYDILGVDFKNKLLNVRWNNLPADGPVTKLPTLSKDAPAFLNVAEASSDFYSFKEGTSNSSKFSVMETDHLLDAVVSRACSSAKLSSDEDMSCRKILTKISSSSDPSGSLAYGPTSVSEQAQRELFDVSKSLQKVGTVASSSLRSGYGIDGSSQNSSICGSQLSSLVGQNVRHDGSVSTAFSKKNNETGKPNRKRLKPGENPRPRPKDRQMIQDRVKELREIVPNGAKCSIDALLERTIKHMLFLQSVTKHADKLKQTGESKIINKDGGLLLKDNSGGGATWAYEVGSHSMVCPIIVEDLNLPRQMLVEMLCEKRGFFLEIADLIRGLGLTILKGVMESRNDKIWARFTVEANRDVTRMEIFMSLVQLLEQTVKDGSTSSASALENNNMMMHHAFPQVTAIHATGRPGTLQ